MVASYRCERDCHPAQVDDQLASPSRFSSMDRHSDNTRPNELVTGARNVVHEPCVECMSQGVSGFISTALIARVRTRDTSSLRYCTAVRHCEYISSQLTPSRQMLHILVRLRWQDDELTRQRQLTYMGTIMRLPSVAHIIACRHTPSRCGRPFLGRLSGTATSATWCSAFIAGACTMRHTKRAITCPRGDHRTG